MRSGRFEPVELEDWRGNGETERPATPSAKGKKAGAGAPGKAGAPAPKKAAAAPSGIPGADKGSLELIKKEKMPDGRTKVILRDKATGRIVQTIE
jgi:hypothetical protein